MASAYFLVFSLLFQLVLLYSAEEEKSYAPGCPPFHCGQHLGMIGFPFTNSTQSKCGILTVVNCNEPEPVVRKIQLKKGEKWYDLLSVSQADSIGIRDPSRFELLQSKNCAALENFTFPSSPSISFTFATPMANITLFKCNRTLNITSHADFNYTGCRDYNIYYNNPHASPPILSPQCSSIQLPININHRNNSDLFGLLDTKIYYIQPKVSEGCSDCYHRGGQCQEVSNGNFRCANANEREGLGNNKRHRKLELFIGIGCLAAFSMLGFVVFIFWRRYKRKYASSDFLSRNFSLYPSSKSGLERGSIYFGVAIFSYCELEEATNNFDPNKELGDGGFGTVYHGILRDGREVAVKRLYEKNYKQVEQFMNEVEILTRLRHKNLVSLYGCTSRHSRELILVYEFIPNGTVADHLHGDRAMPNPLTWPIRMSIAIETAGALAYLHASDIIHRDVKTNNILLDNNFGVKVADFGLSRLFPTDATHVSTAPQGTPGYVDPEYYQSYQLTDKSDVYSFGVVLIELISSLPAVDTSRHRHEINLANLAIKKIQNHALSELVDPCLGFESRLMVRRMINSVAELAFRCLQQDKEMRPCMDEVLEVLKGIESEKHQMEKTEEEDNDVGVLNSTRPQPSSPDSDDIGLLKIQSSPNTVTAKWASSPTTPSVSA